MTHTMAFLLLVLASSVANPVLPGPRGQKLAARIPADMYVRRTGARCEKKKG
jgi:hypothetical protein